MPRPGRMMRLGNFQGRGILLIWIKVGQSTSVLALGVGRCCLEFFTFP